jgi:hypothetical protein
MKTLKYSVNQHLIETILSWVKSGEIAIPEIQRPFVWDATKVRDLMDSLYPGYPIGYLIAWPLHAVYRKEPMLAAIKEAPGESEESVLTISSQLKNVNFLPMNKIREIAPRLETFTNINTLDELKRYDILMRR